MSTDLLPDLDAAGLLAASSSAVRERRRAEVRDLEVLAHWAALHSTDPTDGPDAAHARRIGDVLVHPGGEGTPGVQDFCLGEIALARGTGVTATANALADVLDLQHRLPRTWTVLRTGEAEVYIARRVATLSRHLPADRVGVVDAAVARIITHEAGGRVLAVAEAKIIEADPALHDQRVEAEKARRYVTSGRTDAHGLRTVIARLEAGDAVWVEATVARVAEILTPTHPDVDPDALRAIAFGFLARPAELLQLLLEHTEQGDPALIEPADIPSRATAFPADLLDALRTVDLTPLAPKAVLYVHLHEAALTGADAVARVEGLGPVPLSGLCSLLGRTRLTVRPVRDLASRVRSTSYEHPEALKEQTYLRTTGDYWPYATSTSRHVDYDHPTPYQHPPGSEPSSGPPDTRPPRPDRCDSAEAPADRVPQLRPPRPTTPPLEDPRRLPITPVRRRPLRLAHPTRPRVPRRPPRHPPHRPRQGPRDPRRTTRSRPLLHVTKPGRAAIPSSMILPAVRDPRLVTTRRGGTLTDEHHHLLALWAAECAEHVLALFETARPDDPHPRRAIEAARSWARGEQAMMATRAAGGHAMGAARDLRGAPRFAAYAAGQAAVVAHVAEHDLGAAAYAIRAAVAAGPPEEAEVIRSAECRWQRSRLPDAVRVLVLEDQQRRNNICWDVFSA